MNHIMDRLYFIIDSLTKLICKLLLASIIIIIIVEIFFRYVLNSPLGWPEEIARFLFIWLSFLGTALAIKEKVLAGINYFIDKFTTGYMKYFHYVVHILIVIFLLSSIIGSYKIVKIGMNISLTSTSIPWGYAYIAFPIGLGLSLFYYVYILINERAK